jgi:predicted PurR-regulated permease PerM
MLEIRITNLDAGRLRSNALIGVGLLIVLYLAYVVREVWLPLFLAFLIALVLDPLVDRMEARGWSRLKGSLIIFAVFFGVTSGILAVAIPAIVTQTMAITKSISEYIPSGDNETQTKASLNHILKKVHASPFVASAVIRASSQISAAFSRSSAHLGDAAQVFMANLLWAIIIPIVAFYALKDFHILYARLLMLVPHPKRNFTQNLVNEITGIFVGYLRGIVIICALNGVATAALLAAFRVPNPLALGTIAGLLYVVPYFGPVMTYVAVAGACLTSGTISIQMTLIILLLLVVLHSLIFDQIITPRIFSDHVGLHPILSIMALLIGGGLLGVVGMILAVPVAGVIQMILKVIFPRLAQPIEVPAGEQLHALNHLPDSAQTPLSSAEAAIDVHQTIVNAVDVADASVPERVVPIGEEEVRAAPLRPSKT